jgi:hypothetical protein
MVKITFAAILAASVVAPALGAAIAIDRVEARDVANTDSELFGRAVAEVFNDLYSREELSDLVGRDIEEFTTRDLEELMEREFDIDESMITRDLLDASELDARAPIFKWIKKKLGFGSAPTEEQTARDFDEEVYERDSMDEHDLEARAPIFKWIKKKLGFGGSSSEEQVAARDFDEEFEVRAEGAAPAPAPKQPNIIEKFLNLFRNKNHPGAKKAAAAKKNGGAAPAPKPAAEAPAPPAEAPAAEAPAAREYLEEAFERSFDDYEFEERDYEVEDAFERDFDEDAYERDFDEEMFEREYEFDELD